MRKHLKYLRYVLIHKWFVFLACLEYGLIWRGIKHDWTKFLPSEWFPYVAYFHGEKVPHLTKKVFEDGELVPLMEHPKVVQDAFDKAWNHHQKANSHHWQYWLLSPDNPRPNFTMQSYDGGMTHTYIGHVADGRKAALVYDYDLTKFEPDRQAEMELDRDLWNTPVPLEMPLVDAMEMIADWRGAGKALGKPETWKWYEANKRNMFLHPNTRAWVENELSKLKLRHERNEWIRKVVP